jgi:putative ATP-dependent endonuclease of OLD family
MRLAHLSIENFRIYGAKATAANLELAIRPGLTLLVGQNDSGKSAIIDALRIILGTTSQDYVRISEEDFHHSNGTVANEFSIYCRFEDLTDAEAARFLEWLSLTEGKPILELTLRAHQVERTNKIGAKVPMVDATTRTGPNGQGKTVDGEIRSFLRLTYLKPLRDAETEMAAGRGSRLSQLLLNHQGFKDQDQPSELPPLEPGKPQAPPPTLRGIVEISDRWIGESPAIAEARKQLNADYLQKLSVGSDKLTGEITIHGRAGLRAILEKLELWLTKEGVTDHTRHGLGLNNLLFMAAELLLLSQSAEAGLPLLLIEEPEAHLHPQLQLRLMEFLEESAIKSGVQAILTTHSPNLASKVKLVDVSIVDRGKVFPLSEGQTALAPGDYRFLEKFLDATRANLFFARGVVIVEGDAENILIPVLAELIGSSFAHNGVSIVNVGHRGLFRYGRVFQRAAAPELPIPVACISDRDIPPDEVAHYLGDRDKEADFIANNKLAEHEAALRKYDGQRVKTFVSPQWTLEYDLALCGLAEELHMAIATAKALTETGIVPNAAAIAAAKQDFATEKAKNLTPKQLAAFVFKPLFKRQASKVETAQQLAAALKDSNPNPAQLRQKLPAYLVEAIEYACGTTPHV